MRIDKYTWRFMYNITDLPDPNTLVKHCMNLHNTLNNGDYSDLHGTDLCVELEHIKSLLPKDVSSPKEVFGIFGMIKFDWLFSKHSDDCTKNFVNDSSHCCQQ